MDPSHLDLSRRPDIAQLPELMDQPCSYEDLRQCLHDIGQVNQLTRGFAPTFHWLNQFYAQLPRQQKPIHIVDVGCGFGDMLRRIYLWAQDRRLPVILTGVDLNPNAVRAAREATLPGRATFLTGNAFHFNPPEGIDIVISSLLTHHLQEPEIVEFLKWMESTARLGWFINDLHRQRLPYHAFRLLSRFTTWHRFVKHDGAVSILRSFRRDDWLRMLNAANIPQDSVQLRDYRPARLCVARLR